MILEVFSSRKAKKFCHDEKPIFDIFHDRLFSSLHWGLFLSFLLIYAQWSMFHSTKLSFCDVMVFKKRSRKWSTGETNTPTPKCFCEPLRYSYTLCFRLLYTFDLQSYVIKECDESISPTHRI